MTGTFLGSGGSPLVRSAESGRGLVPSGKLGKTGVRLLEERRRAAGTGKEAAITQKALKNHQLLLLLPLLHYCLRQTGDKTNEL